MICTELMILTHVGPFFLPVRHNTQPIGDERLRGEGRGAKRILRRCTDSQSKFLYHKLDFKHEQGMSQMRKKAMVKIRAILHNIIIYGKLVLKRHCSILSTVVVVATRGEPR